MSPAKRFAEGDTKTEDGQRGGGGAFNAPSHALSGFGMGGVPKKPRGAPAGAAAASPSPFPQRSLHMIRT